MHGRERILKNKAMKEAFLLAERNKRGNYVSKANNRVHISAQGRKILLRHPTAWADIVILQRA